MTSFAWCPLAAWCPKRALSSHMGYLATSRQYGNALLGVRHQEEAHLSARICLRVFGGAILSARYCLRAVVVAQLSCAFMSMNRYSEKTAGKMSSQPQSYRGVSRISVGGGHWSSAKSAIIYIKMASFRAFWIAISYCLVACFTGIASTRKIEIYFWSIQQFWNYNYALRKIACKKKTKMGQKYWKIGIKLRFFVHFPYFKFRGWWIGDVHPCLANRALTLMLVLLLLQPHQDYGTVCLCLCVNPRHSQPSKDKDIFVFRLGWGT